MTVNLIQKNLILILTFLFFMECVICSAIIKWFKKKDDKDDKDDKGDRWFNAELS